MSNLELSLTSLEGTPTLSMAEVDSREFEVDNDEVAVSRQRSDGERAKHLKPNVSRHSSEGHKSSMEQQEIQRSENNHRNEDGTMVNDSYEATNEEKSEVSDSAVSPNNDDTTCNQTAANRSQFHNTLATNRLLSITANHPGDDTEFDTTVGQSRAPPRNNLSLSYNERVLRKMNSQASATSMTNNQRNQNNMNNDIEIVSEGRDLLSGNCNNDISQSNTSNNIQNEARTDYSVNLEDEESRPGAFFSTGLPPGQMPAWIGNRFTSHRRSASETSRNSGSRCSHGETTEEIVQPIAELVDSGQLRNEISQNILQNATLAEVVNTENTTGRSLKICYFLLAVAALITVIGLSVGLTNKNNKNPSMSPTNTRPTLETIQDRGKLLCAHGPLNFQKKFCKGLAAAIFNDRSKVVLEEAENPYQMLDSNQVDVAVSIVRVAMDNDVYEKHTGKGYSYTYPYHYDGIRFGGESKFLNCTQRLDGFFGYCKGVRICVRVQDDFNAVSEWYPSSMIKLVRNFSDFYESFHTGKCNILAGISVYISKEQLIEHTDDTSYESSYSTGDLLLSRQVSAVVTREDDSEWSDFVKWSLQALFAAQERKITQDNADMFGPIDVFGSKYKNMFINIIKEIGNGGDLRRETTEIDINNELSHLNNGSTGLIYSLPFGEDVNAPLRQSPPNESPTMNKITFRKILKCGVPTMVETETWRELGKEYCRAIAAGLFGKNSNDMIQFENIATEGEGFVKLYNDEVDLLVGSRVTLRADVREKSTQKGFTFSLPYFYTDPKEGGDSPYGDSIALVTREDDPRWSDFVFWIVSATFYAEEKHITKNNSDEMPVVNLFGDAYGSMFENAISIVGGYNEMFENNVNISREKRNQLNNNPFTPQMNPDFLVD